MSLAVAFCFWALASAIATLRQDIVYPRPGEFVHRDVLSRVRFESRDADREQELRQQARDACPRTYRRVDGPFASLERRLAGLPDDVSRLRPEQFPRELHLDSGSITSLKTVAPDEFRKWVRQYISLLNEASDKGALVVLPWDDREQDLQVPERKVARVQRAGPTVEFAPVDLAKTFARKSGEVPEEKQRFELLRIVGPMADQCFLAPLAANIAGFTVDTLEPTCELDRDLTGEEQAQAARNASVASATRRVMEKAMLVPRESSVTASQWKLLGGEHREVLKRMPGGQRWLMHAGMAGIVLIITLAMSAYVVGFQPRVAQNPTRAIAIAALMLAMLLVAQLAGIGSGPLLIFGIAPTILVAMIMGIAYDQRFAIGTGSLHGLLVCVSLNQDVGFFLVMWLGVLTCCFLLDEVRTRSKPIEVGGAAALAMMLGAAAIGALSGDPAAIIGRSCLHAGAAGLGVGFVILGILPFVERAFKITTSMTLLELADVSQPLLRRLSIEAPGTYNHSLQVATLAEAAAEAVGADALLCRVGSYYHDIGKAHKADYFCENQSDGRNRHLSLTPGVSLQIIHAHVKDGIELAKEYGLPAPLLPIIQQHHGTMIVEYFYHQACKSAASAAEPPVDAGKYRYAGPRPRSREAAIVMIADAAESACRAITEPTPGRVESLVHDLVMKRLLDGQLDDCDLTFGELRQVERSLVKSLLGIYHSRLAYPSTADAPGSAGSASGSTVKSA